MQVFVHLPLKSMRQVRGHRQSNYYSGHLTAVRLIGPERPYINGDDRGRTYVYADVEIPEDLLAHVSPGYIRADGTYRAEVTVNTHRKTLAAFLASGDLEWDVREMA